MSTFLILFILEVILSIKYKYKGVNYYGKKGFSYSWRKRNN
jgi:hypothetical protein